MAILVTGGAGYIGSVNVALLREAGHEVVVLDNLSRGFRAAVAAEIPFYQGDVGDRHLVARIAREHRVEACLHFAAYAYVGESVLKPRLYFENNVAQATGLLAGLLEAGVRRLVFSSTCATYGEPRYVPIDEAHPQQPTNPYGWSKFFAERMLEASDRAEGLRFVGLRYFNAAGAIPGYGERHDPETHLIPNILSAAAGALPEVTIFGQDYPTPDGTAIRDYIHVADLARAHLLALDYLETGGESDFFNLGNERGASVLEVIEVARRVTGRPIPIRFEPARPGDPSRLVANADKARQRLGWRPVYPELPEMVESAWEWMCRRR
jgi:UDP-glucose 4-epimerase